MPLYTKQQESIKQIESKVTNSAHKTYKRPTRIIERGKKKKRDSLTETEPNKPKNDQMGEDIIIRKDYYHSNSGQHLKCNVQDGQK